MKNKGDLVYVALIAFFIGTLTDYLLRSDTQINIPADTVKFWLDAATAFGTVAAVIVALWLGLRNARDTRQHEQIRGRMACSLLAMRAHRASVDLSLVVDTLREYNDDDYDFTNYLKLSFLEVLELPLAEEITVDTLAVIAGISDQAAVDLGLAAAKLKIAVNWRDLNRREWMLYTPEDREEVVGTLRSHVAEAASRFDAAANEMFRRTANDLKRFDERIKGAVPD